MKVRLVYAAPEVLFRREIELECGSSVEEALRICGVYGLFPDLAKSPVGINGRVVTMSQVLADGDRLEIYRPLRAEPKQARLERIRMRKAVRVPGRDKPS